MDRRRSGWAHLTITGMCVLMVIGAWAAPVHAQRQGRFFEQVVTSGAGGGDFSVSHGSGNPIHWTHSLSASDIAAANSGGVIVDAWDVDYPGGTEHDRLTINGRDYGLLEGRNNQLYTNEKSISVGDLHAGSNAFKVDPDELNQGWVLRIERSTLYLYADDDFDITATPDTRSVSPTDTATYSVRIDWIGVWDNDVDLSVAGLPAGAEAVFSPSTITADGGAGTLTVTLTNVAPGTYPMTITATGTADHGDNHGSRQVTHTAGVELVVVESGPPGGFTLSADPSTRHINQGGAAAYDVTALFNETWNSPVTLAVTAGLPAGAVAVFDTQTVTQDGELRHLTVTSALDTPAGTYTLTITGTGNGKKGAVTRTTTVDLVVGQSGFTLAAKPKRIEVEIGQTVSGKIRSRFFGDCKGPLTIKIKDSYCVVGTKTAQDFNQVDTPDKIVARLLRTSLTPDDNDTDLMMRVGLEMAPGEYNIVIRGRGCGQKDQNVTVRLIVKAAHLKITKRQSQTAVNPNMVQIYSIRVENQGLAPATGVTVIDEMASDLSYVSDTAVDATHSVAAGTHTWIFNKPLRPGASLTFNVNARVNAFVRAGRSISNRAIVVADQMPTPVVSNTVTATTGYVAVTPDGIQVTKRALKHDARVGGILTYRIEVKNISQAGPVFDIELKDRMPGGFKIPAGKTLRDGSAYSDPARRGRVYTWRLGNLGPGERTTITYQAVVGTNAASGRNENTATATGKDGGGNRVSGSDSALVMLGAGDIEELGQIKVLAYRDRNHNEMRDGSDQPMAGVEIILVPPGLKQATDEKGETVFTELRPGQYVVAVNELKLAEDVNVSGDTSRVVRLLEGESADSPFLLYIDPGIGKLVVRVFSDRNRNGAFDDQEPVVETFTALLDGKTKSRGKNGQVLFSRLEPGQHTLMIDAGGKRISKKVDIQTGHNGLDIPMIPSRLKIKIQPSGE